jgi:hypothetical protein
LRAGHHFISALDPASSLTVSILSWFRCLIFICYLEMFSLMSIFLYFVVSKQVMAFNF